MNRARQVWREGRISKYNKRLVRVAQNLIIIISYHLKTANGLYSHKQNNNCT